MRLCSIDGCGRQYRCSGLCNLHYLRRKLHGSALYEPKKGHLRTDGYVASTVSDLRQYEHIRVAERALGKPLPAGAQVHHVNEDKSDNRPENLVICPDAKYHRLLHMRMRAVEAGYPAHYRRCYTCKQYDDPEVMYQKPNTAHIRHRRCEQVRAA